MARPTRTNPLPFWLTPARANRPTGRTLTIRRIIEREIALTGRAPSDEDLARLLAISAQRVRHHRNLLKM